MKKEMVFMPIGLLNLKKISLENVLKMERLLMDLVKRYNIAFNIEGFLDEAKHPYILQSFSCRKEYIEHCINRYAPGIKMIKYAELLGESEYKKFEKYVGSYSINIEVFNYLNQMLWPDILNVHTTFINQSDVNGNIMVKLCFDTSNIKDFYPYFRFDRMLNEFFSDLSLYLTYNRLGILNLDAGYVISNQTIEIDCEMFIY